MEGSFLQNRGAGSLPGRPAAETNLADIGSAPRSPTWA